jgi:hypothetical protein
MPRGELVFGSELMSNRLADYELGALLLRGTRSNGLHTVDLRGHLSKIYALDLVLGNHDRHQGNFLMTVEWSADSSTRSGHLRPFDFESSDVVKPRSGRLPMNPTSSTVRTGRLIREVHGFDSRPATQMLTQLAKGREFIFERATNGLPEEWLSDTERTKLLERVSSESFALEIDQITQGLSDGTYL